MKRLRLLQKLADFPLTLAVVSPRPVYGPKDGAGSGRGTQSIRLDQPHTPPPLKLRSF